MTPHPHISEQFDQELDQARNRLMEMGGKVEQQLKNACEALTNHDLELAQTIKAGDRSINQLEVDLDELCVQIIARRQPAASDLRTLVSVMKASTDLERIGDEAKRIAKMAIAISRLTYPRDQYTDIRKLAASVMAQVSGTLDAFARLDVDKAIGLIREDAEIDDAYDAIVRDRAVEMKEMADNPEGIEQTLHVLWAARALERIGDHAKNISEVVVFLVKGEDIRDHALAAKLSAD
jgi:phosphate transport system protein